MFCRLNTVLWADLGHPFGVGLWIRLANLCGTMRVGVSGTMAYDSNLANQSIKRHFLLALDSYFSALDQR